VGSDALAAALLACGPAQRVAIIGFGGLGQVGVKVATAMGASTTAINHMEQQMDDALQMGAAGFRTIKDST
jgi:uncharacterized zinc-type alcohol dehydrogenase-like protein